MLGGGEIPHISNLVYIYNLISLKYRTPVGGEDLDRIDGNIFLKFAEGDERFVVLGAVKMKLRKKTRLCTAPERKFYAGNGTGGNPRILN